jgi:hypothetical protein
VSNGADSGYPGRGWATFRDDWAARSQATRLLAVGAVSARRAYALALAAAWDELLPLIDEADERKLPRDADLWVRLSDALSRTIDAAEDDEEFGLADALIALSLTTRIFGIRARDKERAERRRPRERRPPSRDTR